MSDDLDRLLRYFGLDAHADPKGYKDGESKVKALLLTARKEELRRACYPDTLPEGYNPLDNMFKRLEQLTSQEQVSTADNPPTDSQESPVGNANEDTDGWKTETIKRR